MLRSTIDFIKYKIFHKRIFSYFCKFIYVILIIYFITINKENCDLLNLLNIYIKLFQNLPNTINYIDKGGCDSDIIINKIREYLTMMKIQVIFNDKKYFILKSIISILINFNNILYNIKNSVFLYDNDLYVFKTIIDQNLFLYSSKEIFSNELDDIE